MDRRFFAICSVVCMLSFYSARAGETPIADELPSVKLIAPYPKLKLNRPVFICHSGDGSGRMFLIEQDGKILILPKEKDGTPSVFLDIKSKITRVDNEEGLLCVAFHPKYKENGFFYVWYASDKPLRHVLARFSVSKTDPNVADAGSEKILLTFEKPYGNHNGATTAFGPDGFLYASIGDGGKALDPHGNGQNLQTLLAKAIRIDVDKESDGKAYAIPADNPYADGKLGRPEIFASGLRNIWRMSFDRKTGLLWGGDVGQEKFEEVNVIVKGGNYGWNIREGREKHVKGMPETGKETFTDPAWVYGRALGTSITGGHVYRGNRIPKLQGAYVCGDYTLGNIFALRLDGPKVTGEKIILKQPKNIASFGEDPDGELYVIMFDGNLFEIHPDDEAPPVK